MLHPSSRLHLVSKYPKHTCQDQLNESERAEGRFWRTTFTSSVPLIVVELPMTAWLSPQWMLIRGCWEVLQDAAVLMAALRASQKLNHHQLLGMGYGSLQMVTGLGSLKLKACWQQSGQIVHQRVQEQAFRCHPEVLNRCPGTGSAQLLLSFDQIYAFTCIFALQHRHMCCLMLIACSQVLVTPTDFRRATN